MSSAADAVKIAVDTAYPRSRCAQPPPPSRAQLELELELFTAARHYSTSARLVGVGAELLTRVRLRRGAGA